MATVATALVERASELAILGDIVQSSTGCAVIEGQSGIGKTALMSQALTAAPQHTMVRLARASPLEQGLSGGVILQLLSSVVDAKDDLMFDGAAHGARALFDPQGRTLPEGLALFHALHSLCVNLSRDRRLVLALDDAQWADRLSLEFLAYLIRRVEDLPIAVILALHAGESAVTDRFVMDICDIPQVQRIRPAALTKVGASEVVTLAMGEPQPDHLVELWWERSGGVPLFLLELARQFALGVDTTAPDSVVRLVQSRLDRLPAAARQVAVSLSVLGASASQIEIAQLSEMDPHVVLEHLDHLDRGELVTAESCSFAHPVLGEAVLAAVPSGELSLLRIRAARIVHRDAPSRAAAQLAALGPSVHTGETWAASTLYAASTEALERGSRAEAVGYLLRALGEPANKSLRFRILLELGRLRAPLREREALSHFDQATRLAGSPLDRARTALLHGEALFHFGELERCSRVCLAAVSELGDAHRELALQLHSMAFNADGVTGSRRDRAAAFLDEVAEAASPGQRAVLTHVVADAAARGSWTAVKVREMGRRALAGGALLADVGAASPTYIFCGTALAWADEFRTVIDLTERGLEIGERSGSRMAIAYSSALHAGVLLRSGRLEDAEESATRVVEELADADPMAYGISVGWLIDSVREQGRVEDARKALRNSGLDGPLPPLGTVAFLMLARGNLYLAEGDAAAAEREFAEVGDIAEESLYLNPAALAWRSGRALACLALGRREDAMRWALSEVALARDFGAGRALAISLFAQARCEESVAKRDSMLQESANAAHDAGARLEEARALVELGRIQAVANDPRARETLEEAMDLADQCGAKSLWDSAKEAVLLTGARPRRRRNRGPESLTRQERKVSSLAAAGKLNREIADDLCISIGTVETHLTNSYKKLGVSSRNELMDGQFFASH